LTQAAFAANIGASKNGTCEIPPDIRWIGKRAVRGDGAPGKASDGNRNCEVVQRCEGLRFYHP
jgi:hypothetical protein